MARKNFKGKKGRRFFKSMLFILLLAIVYYLGTLGVPDLSIPAFNLPDFNFDLPNFFARGQDHTVADGEIMVSFIDVGQGDSALIRCANHAVLIDGGEHHARNAVMGYLREAGVTFIDYVVATHPHSDHIGGLITVLRQMDVGAVIMPDVVHHTATFERFLDVIDDRDIPVIFPTPGQVIQAGLLNFTVLGPPTPHPGGDLNNASIVMRLAHGSTSFLFTGDAERPLEEWLISSGQNLTSNVLKVAHHGSRTSTIENFLYQVSPQAAVISLGANNRYNHPHPEVIERLNNHHVRIYRTDQMGTIRMITDGSDISLLRE